MNVTKPVTTIINTALRRADSEIRLIRGRGYYWFYNAINSESIYTMWLNPNERELWIAFDYTIKALHSEHIDPGKFVAAFNGIVERMQRPI